jgi:hypothetical protein
MKDTYTHKQAFQTYGLVLFTRQVTYTHEHALQKYGLVLFTRKDTHTHTYTNTFKPTERQGIGFK